MSPSPPSAPTVASTPAALELGVDAARAAIDAAIQASPLPLQPPETAPLASALGRVLAADLVSALAVPAHDNAAMDGYAFDGTALRPGRALTLAVAGSALAGRPFNGSVAAGACVRIMTGAVMPAGLDTVVALERCHAAADGSLLHVDADTVQRGANRRRRGEDLAPGQPALRAGRRLRPADLGLAASLGLQQLQVRPRLRVALFSSGDELTPAGQPLLPGAIYDSNRSSLAGALQRLGMQVLDLGLVADDPQALRDTLRRASMQADVVLTSGGVSAGDADHTRQVLQQLGDVVFWQVLMRPGRPFAFGRLHAADGRALWLFALPGNPVAALVSFYVLVRSGLLRLAGAEPAAPLLLQARCSHALPKRPGRSEYLRATLGSAADGTPQVTPLPQQGSGVLRGMSEANALIVLTPDAGPVPAGALVPVWLWDAAD